MSSKKFQAVMLRVMAVVMTVILTFGILPAKAQAYEPNDVVAIGDQGYQNLSLALNAFHDGDVIRVLQDFQGDQALNYNHNSHLVIDLNGHNIQFRTLDVSGDLTIRGGGSLNALWIGDPGDEHTFTVNGSTVILENDGLAFNWNSRHIVLNNGAYLRTRGRISIAHNVPVNDTFTCQINDTSAWEMINSAINSGCPDMVKQVLDRYAEPGKSVHVGGNVANTLILRNWDYLAAHANGSGDGEGPCRFGHDVQYHVCRIPTTEIDGEAMWSCSRCGYIDRYHDPEADEYGIIRLSAYPVFNSTLLTLIAEAPENGTVTITTRRWESVKRSVLEALIKRPDVKLVVDFRGTKDSGDLQVTLTGSDPLLQAILTQMSGDKFFGLMFLYGAFETE